MTEREKREREEFYQTVILSLDEIPSLHLTLSWMRQRDILQELLPMRADAGSIAELLVRALLLGTLDRPIYEDSEENEQVLEYAANPKETQRLYQAVNTSQTDKEWTEAMQDLGWHCLEILDAIWTENLLP